MSYFFTTVHYAGAGLLLLLSSALAPLAQAQEPSFRHAQVEQHKDNEHQFGDHGAFDSPDTRQPAYPSVGSVVGAVPGDHEVIYDGDGDLYYAAGVWYRRQAADRFVVVMPPIGVTISALPPGCTTVYANGVPHCYANEIYYLQSPGGYLVVDSPASEASSDRWPDSADSVSPPVCFSHRITTESCVEPRHQENP